MTVSRLDRDIANVIAAADLPREQWSAWFRVLQLKAQMAFWGGAEWEAMVHEMWFRGGAPTLQAAIETATELMWERRHERPTRR